MIQGLESRRLASSTTNVTLVGSTQRKYLDTQEKPVLILMKSDVRKCL